MTPLQLAEACEGATRATQDLDKAAATALGFGKWYADGAPEWALTGSVSQIMRLIPDGWHITGMEDRFYDRRWHVSVAELPTAEQIAAYEAGGTFGVRSEEATAATPALALVAASLRAVAKGEG